VRPDRTRIAYADERPDDRAHGALWNRTGMSEIRIGFADLVEDRHAVGPSPETVAGGHGIERRT
jgi:hypothetical protein